MRNFQDRVPDQKTIELLLKAATRAPSAGNLQPWHFYVIYNRPVKEKLAAAALAQRHVASAPLVVVVCVDQDRSARRYGGRGRDLYCIQDAAAATQNLLLAAVDQGLAGCWVGAFDEREVARLLKAPRGRRPLALVPLGYPARPLRLSSRRELDETVTFLE